MQRVVAQGDMRPMAGNAEAMDDLKRILSGREALYAKADLTSTPAASRRTMPLPTCWRQSCSVFRPIRLTLHHEMHYISMARTVPCTIVPISRRQREQSDIQESIDGR